MYYDGHGKEVFRRQMGTEWNDNIVNTQINWMDLKDGSRQGGLVISTAVDNVPSEEFDGIDYVLQVTPKNEVNVLFGDLTFETQNMLSNSWSPTSISESSSSLVIFFAITLLVACTICVSIIVNHKSVQNLARSYQSRKNKRRTTEIDDQQAMCRMIEADTLPGNENQII